VSKLLFSREITDVKFKLLVLANVVHISSVGVAKFGSDSHTSRGGMRAPFAGNARLSGKIGGGTGGGGDGGGGYGACAEHLLTIRHKINIFPIPNSIFV